MSKVSRVIKTPAVIIDNGSGSCKAGISGESQPTSIVPSVVGHFKERPEEIYIGGGALSKKGALLSYPVERGIISCWDDMEKLLRYIYKYELEVKPSTRPAFLSEPPRNPLKNREKITEVMLESFQVPALYLAIQATLALYSLARTTGLVLDSGDGVTHAVPIYDGYCLPHGVSRLPVAGKDVADYLANLLLKDNPDLVSQANKTVLRFIKENFCYVALDPKREAQKKMEETVKLPDGNTIKVHLDLCQAPEILFTPKTIGIEAPGIHTMIIRSIQKCDKDIWAPLFGNVVLSGGSSCFRGLAGRICKEIEHHVPSGVPIRIVMSPQTSCAAWVGASIISNLTSFQPMWFTQEDYKEFGVAGIHRKCF